MWLLTQLEKDLCQKLLEGSSGVYNVVCNFIDDRLARINIEVNRDLKSVSTIIPQRTINLPDEKVQGSIEKINEVSFSIVVLDNLNTTFIWKIYFKTLSL